MIKNILRGRRSWLNKIRETVLAVKAERILSKEQILEQYLNRIPFGNNQYGIYAACRFYLDKTPDRINPAEAAFLAGLPRSPTYYNPLRKYERSRERSLGILDRMHKLGLMGSGEWTTYRNRPVRPRKGDRVFLAAHFCDAVMDRLPEIAPLATVKSVRTTLDYGLYRRSMRIIENRINSLKLFNVGNCAVVVIDNRTGDILTMVGSRDYFDESIDGQYNTAFGLRQPGSALKPFTYALALDKGWSLADVLPDIETRFPSSSGAFIPRNYDRQFHGPVRLRDALACSYNVPAVQLLNRLDPAALLRVLREAGFSSLRRPPDYYGLGLTLGNGETTLVELTRGFTAFARDGRPVEVRWILSVTDHSNREISLPSSSGFERVFSPESAWMVADVLSDNDARLSAFGDDSYLRLPFPAGAKTGTSKNYRDNWTCGFNERVTVGVWVGNADNSPMMTVSGVAGAGPIWHDIMVWLQEERGLGGWMKRPSTIEKRRICTLSGKTPGPACPVSMAEYFRKSDPQRPVCNYHIRTAQGAIAVIYPPEYRHWARENSEDDKILTGGFPDVRVAILYPPDKTRFVIDPDKPRGTQSIRIKGVIPDEAGSVEWYLDERLVSETAGKESFDWILQFGKHSVRLRVRQQDGLWEESRVGFEVF
jgi:penicillin-binding protein 1C